MDENLKIIYTAPSNKKIIFIHIGFRAVMLALIIYFMTMDRDAFKEMTAGVVGIVLFSFITVVGLVWVLFPLIHLKDKMQFWEKGIVIKNIPLTYDDLGNVQFVNVDRGPFHYLRMYTDVEKYDVSYIKDIKNVYEQQYLIYKEKFEDVKKEELTDEIRQSEQDVKGAQSVDEPNDQQ